MLSKHEHANIAGAGTATMNLEIAASVRVLMLLGMGILLAASTASIAEGTGSQGKQEFDSVMHLKSDLARGEQVFDTCAACHGSTGAGSSDGTVPAIAGQHFRVIAWELVSFRHGTRHEPRMEHFTDAHHLRDAQDIADITGYVSRLTPPPSSSHVSGEHTVRGLEIYKRHCSSCHGMTARGDDRKRYPRLAGQHYEYLMAQLHDAADGQRPNFSIRHTRLLRSFGPEDLTAVCEYLSHLGP
jgi:cytochrome c553